MLEVYTYEGINEDDCFSKCVEELDVYPSELIINSCNEADKFILRVIKKEEFKNFVKQYLKDVIGRMNLDINLELNEDGDIFYVNLFSNNNPILIGKEGKNLNALQFLLRQTIKNKIGYEIKINLDASNYRVKKVKNFEYQIKNIVRDVQKTKIDTKLDPMNSYERRIVHSLLSNFNNVTTESVGEEPNRCVVIKYIGE